MLFSHFAVLLLYSACADVFFFSSLLYFVFNFMHDTYILFHFIGGINAKVNKNI